MRIDRQIQDRVDQFRGNPNLLQRRYQQDKNLIDLLALQKLKSEKEDAVKQIQMSMQTSPLTIKQQREQQVMGLTTNQVAQGVGNALRNKQAQQQRNLQRVAQTGIAGRAPTMGMAEGGIVGFAPGGGVDFNDFDESTSYQDRVDAINAMPIPEADKVALLRKLSQEATASPKGAQEGAIKPITPDLSQLPAASAPIESKNYTVDKGAGTPLGKATADLQTGIETLTSADPSDASQERYDESMGRIGYTKKEGDALTKLMADRKTMNDELIEQSKKEEGLAALINAATGSTLGLTGAKYAAGAMNQRNQTAKLRQDLFDDAGTEVKDIINKSQQIRQTADAQAGTARESALADRRSGVSALATLQKTFSDAAQKEADRLLNIDIANATAQDRKRAEALEVIVSGVSEANRALIANQTAAYQMEANRIREQANQITDTGNKLQILTDGINRLTQKKADIVAAIMEDLQTNIANASFGEEDEVAVQEKVNALKSSAQSAVKAATAELEKELQELEALRKPLTGGYKVKR